MADGEMTLKLDSKTEAEIAEAAAAAGLPPEVWTLQVVREAAAERARWAETYRRLDEFDKHGGKTMTVDEAFDELRRRIREQRARL